MAFSDFKVETASEKIVLAQVDASKRLMGWVLDSGSIYKVTFEDQVLLSIKDSGTALTSVASKAAITPGDYFFDRQAKELFLEASTSVDPNTLFMVAAFRLFFSNNTFSGPNDLSTGFDVPWLPQIKGTSQFGVQIDNRTTQLGIAVEGNGSIKFHNDQDFWQPRFDTLAFENKQVSIYSGGRDLAITDFQLIYRGTIQGKSYSPTEVSFSLKDIINQLRAPLTQSDVGDFSYTHDVLGSISARVSDAQEKAKQRNIYGRPNGHVGMNIDQVLDAGYPVSGTFTVTNASPTVSVTSGDFPDELHQNDEIVFSSQPDKKYTIQDFPTDTTLTLTEDFEEVTSSTDTAVIFPERETMVMNRYFLLAGHPLTRASTTITAVESEGRFTVASAINFFVGDPVLVNGDTRDILRIEDTNIIQLQQDLSTVPVVTDAVVGTGVRSVFIDGDELLAGTDYTVDEDTATIFLDRLSDAPEVRIAPLVKLAGTLTFAAASKDVTGGGTTFTAEVRPGDWLQIPTTTDLRQVWQITSDTTLKLTATAGTTVGPSDTLRKSPSYYTGGLTTLSCSLNGKSDDNTKDGDLLKTGPLIVEDMLKDAGLTSILLSSSFTDASDRSGHLIGLATPRTFDATTSSPIRTIINDINRSIFGVLFQNNAFQLEYGLLDPTRNLSDRKFDKTDVLKFSIKSDITNIIKQVNLTYDQKEFDGTTMSANNTLQTSTSDNAEFLAESTKQFDVETFLINASSGRMFASRWAFLLELARGLLSFTTKLQASEDSINDNVQITHEKLYDRFGGGFSRKIGLIQSIKRDGKSNVVTLDDLANAFTRCGAITENTAGDFSSSSEDEKMVNGYITDNNGMQNNDADTFGINVIW